MRAICRNLGAVLVVLGLGSAQAASLMPRVTAVQPSGAEVPANLLRVSIQFEAPVDGVLLSRVTLYEAGHLVVEPFLQQELWSPDAKVLTLMMHPGRVKSATQAHALMGPILTTAQSLVLAIDGHPIKQWRIGLPDEAGPNASYWTLSRVRCASIEPLIVALDAPIEARDAGYLGVMDAEGHRMKGRSHLRTGETVWVFHPDFAWSAGTFRLMVRGTLEDPSGNRLGSRFETLADSATRTPEDVEMSFTCR